MQKGKALILTNDVEDHSIWHNALRLATGEKVLKEGMPLLLDIYSKYNIRSTFFFTGYMAENFPDIVKMVIPAGHEVASHGYSHKVEEAFDVMSYKDQVEHLSRSKKILEDITGNEVMSFRAPALRVNSHTPAALIETGFRIDSSVASQRFDSFLSFGSKKKLKWLSAPRLPYKTSLNDLSKRGNGPLIEIPLTASLLPFTSTTMRIFPLLTSLQKRLIYLENRINNKPVVFDIHPNEFIDESDEKRIIEKRTDGFLSHLLKDKLRGRLKLKNLGEECIPLYSNLIEYFLDNNYKSNTIKDYVEEMGWM